MCVHGFQSRRNGGLVFLRGHGWDVVDLIVMGGMLMVLVMEVMILVMVWMVMILIMMLMALVMMMALTMLTQVSR